MEPAIAAPLPPSPSVGAWSSVTLQTPVANVNGTGPRYRPPSALATPTPIGPRHTFTSAHGGSGGRPRASNCKVDQVAGVAGIGNDTTTSTMDLNTCPASKKPDSPSPARPRITAHGDGNATPSLCPAAMSQNDKPNAIAMCTMQIAASDCTVPGLANHPYPRLYAKYSRGQASDNVANVKPSSQSGFTQSRPNPIPPALPQSAQRLGPASAPIISVTSPDNVPTSTTIIHPASSSTTTTTSASTPRFRLPSEFPVPKPPRQLGYSSGAGPALGMLAALKKRQEDEDAAIALKRQKLYKLVENMYNEEYWRPIFRARLVERTVPKQTCSETVAATRYLCKVIARKPRDDDGNVNSEVKKEDPRKQSPLGIMMCDATRRWSKVRRDNRQVHACKTGPDRIRAQAPPQVTARPTTVKRKTPPSSSMPRRAPLQTVPGNDVSSDRDQSPAANHQQRGTAHPSSSSLSRDPDEERASSSSKRSASRADHDGSTLVPRKRRKLGTGAQGGPTPPMTGSPDGVENHNVSVQSQTSRPPTLTGHPVALPTPVPTLQPAVPATHPPWLAHASHPTQTPFNAVATGLYWPQPTVVGPSQPLGLVPTQYTSASITASTHTIDANAHISPSPPQPVDHYAHMQFAPALPNTTYYTTAFADRTQLAYSPNITMGTFYSPLAPAYGVAQAGGASPLVAPTWHQPLDSTSSTAGGFPMQRGHIATLSQSSSSSLSSSFSLDDPSSVSPPQAIPYQPPYSDTLSNMPSAFPRVPPLATAHSGSAPYPGAVLDDELWVSGILDYIGLAHDQHATLGTQ